MITWAALIILHAAKGGSGEPEDMQAICVHLELLRRTNEPATSLRHRLADRLEAMMQDDRADNTASEFFGIDCDWSLFNEASLRGINDIWAATDSLQDLASNPRDEVGCSATVVDARSF